MCCSLRPPQPTPLLRARPRPRQGFHGSSAFVRVCGEGLKGAFLASLWRPAAVQSADLADPGAAVKAAIVMFWPGNTPALTQHGGSKKTNKPINPLRADSLGILPPILL